MKNWKRELSTYLFTAITAIKSEDVVIISKDRLGVAVSDIAIGEQGVLQVADQVELPSISGVATLWSQGDNLYWDAAAKKVTNIYASGLNRIGEAALDKADSDTQAQVNLNSSSDSARPNNLNSTGFSRVGALNSAPTDADIANSQIEFYLDEGANKLKIRVRYSTGALKTGEVALV